jgi:3-dehydroshikimate dehydratase
LDSAQQIFTPGLVSVTFRQLSPERVVQLVAETGLKSIEWGGDIHVPHGDLPKAARACEPCKNAGIAISAYGSYYRAWASEKNGVSFSAILDIAQELGASTIRVWAGTMSSEAAPPGWQHAVVADLKRICQSAAERECRISLEFHGGTLTDTAPGAKALIDAVAAPNLFTYWQPPVGMAPAECLAGLQLILPHLRDLHVFHWWPDQHHRLPLSDGVDRWRQYLKLAATAGGTRRACLEFVHDDDPDQFRDDAKTLLNLLNSVG